MDKNIPGLDPNSAEYIVGKAIVEDITKALFGIFMKYKDLRVKDVAGVIRLQTDTLEEQLTVLQTGPWPT